MFSLNTYCKIFLFIICMHFNQLTSGILTQVRSNLGNMEIEIEENENIGSIKNRIFAILKDFVNETEFFLYEFVYVQHNPPHVSQYVEQILINEDYYLRNYGIRQRFTDYILLRRKQNGKESLC